MGFIGSVLGTQSGNSGGAGLNFNASGTNIQQAATPEQVKDAYANQAAAYKQQQDFLAALQGQNGIQNQSDVYNRYSQLASGQGPSVAQSQLNNATGQNVANQAALMAGQRGAGANTGLIARQAAQQGGNLQQQAVGQAATLRAQEQLAALGQMGSLSTQQVGQQQGATQFLNQAAQNEQQNLLNSVAQYNNAQVGMQGNINQANAGVSQVAAKGQQDFMGNMMGGGAKAAMMAHDGGEVKSPTPSPQPVKQDEQATKAFIEGLNKSLNYADGGEVGDSFLSNFAKGFNSASNKQDLNGVGDFNLLGSPNQEQSDLGKGSNKAGQAIGSGIKSLFSSGSDSQMAGGAMDAGSLGSTAMMAAHGGKVPALLSPGEMYLPPKAVDKVKKGEIAPEKVGKKIPGKAKVKGDSEKNDFVHANLDVGGIVIPRSQMKSKEKIYNFIKNELAKSSMPRKKK